MIECTDPEGHNWELSQIDHGIPMCTNCGTVKGSGSYEDGEK